MDTSSSSKKAIVGLIVVVLLVAATTAVIALNGNKDVATSNTGSNDATPSAATAASPSSSSATSSTTTGNYKDGTYTATGSYQTPGGEEAIGVTVTLSGGTITDAKVTEEGKTGEAQEYQDRFASGFASQVVGKKISDVSLSRVAGSSLTPIGFNNAISNIEQQAAA